MDDATLGDRMLTSESESPSSHVPAPLLLLPEHRSLSGMGQTSAIDTDFLTKYLDFVFPAIFPFYRPALFETVPCWLLLSLGKSKIAYHSAIRLSCYFFTIALTNAGSGDEHAECKKKCVGRK